MMSHGEQKEDARHPNVKAAGLGFRFHPVGRLSSLVDSTLTFRQHRGAGEAHRGYGRQAQFRGLDAVRGRGLQGGLLRGSLGQSHRDLLALDRAHSGIEPAEQLVRFQHRAPLPSGWCAETSTDAGKSRRSRHDPAKGIGTVAAHPQCVLPVDYDLGL